MRQDIVYAVNMISQFMHKSNKKGIYRLHIEVTLPKGNTRKKYHVQEKQVTS